MVESQVVVASAAAVIAFSGALIVGAGNARADDPPFHVLSAQGLCDMIWPGSQVMPDPAKFGANCVRQDGVLSRLSRALPTLVADTYVLEPGKAVQLPTGSVRTDPKDPLSDWLIPD